MRPCRSDEAERVVALWRSADARETVTDDVHSVERLIARDPEALLLVEDGGAVVGSVIAGFDGWRGCVYRLAVDPVRRRERVASTLVEAAERSLRARGAARVHAIVHAADEPAMAFWASAGYENQAGVARFTKNFD